MTKGKAPYIFRLTSARALMNQLHAVGCMLGLFLKATRDYTLAAGKSRQSYIANASGVSQATVSLLETFKTVPADPTLHAILEEYRFQEEELALVFDLLHVLRKHKNTIDRLDKILH